MQITVTCRHMVVTQAVKDYCEKKINHKIHKHLGDKIKRVHIIMDVQKNTHIAEVELHGQKIDFCAKAKSSDMYASIDAVMDKIEKQLVKHKTKFLKRKHVKADSIRIPKEMLLREEEIEVEIE